MIRKIIEIDADKCNGCGACAEACHEGAIAMVDGKARLMRDDYCDGLGDCLPACPTDAISFVEREAAAYDKQAVEENMKKKKRGGAVAALPQASELLQWPVQIKLAPVSAPYFNGAHLLVAADCTAYAYGNFHREFMRNKITLIGCPKLDDLDYSQKLAGIIRQNEIKSVTVVRMEVPCCGGMEQAVKKALQESGKFIPWNVVVISTDGERMD